MYKLGSKSRVTKTELVELLNKIKEANTTTLDDSSIIERTLTQYLELQCAVSEFHLAELLFSIVSLYDDLDFDTLDWKVDSNDKLKYDTYQWERDRMVLYVRDMAVHKYHYAGFVRRNKITFMGMVHYLFHTADKFAFDLVGEVEKVLDVLETYDFIEWR